MSMAIIENDTHLADYASILEIGIIVFYGSAQ